MSRVTDAQLTELLQRPQSRTLELKRRIPDVRVAARELSALANSGGGQLVVGAGARAGLVGLDDADATAALIRDAVRLVSPQPLVEVGIREVDGRRIVLVEVTSDEPEPMYVGPDGAVTRRGPDGRRIAFSGEGLEAFLTARAHRQDTTFRQETLELLARQSTSLTDATFALQTLKDELAEERLLARRERKQAERARGWRSQSLSWVLAGLVGAVLATALAVALKLG